jgi:hypothetical protein
MPSEKTPGTAPGAVVKDADLAVGRYGSPPASMPELPVRADSARAMIEEIVKREVAQHLGKQDEMAAEGARQVEANQRAQRERAEAREREIAKRLDSLVWYTAKATGWVPMPDPKQGGRLVVKGERFQFGGTPSPRWMEATDAEGQKRLDERAKQIEELRRIADEDTVALSALSKARESIERSNLSKPR